MIDPEDTTLEFREGKRMVPVYLYPTMKTLDTIRMTYDEALAATNRRLESDWLNAQQRDHIAAAIGGRMPR